LPQASDITDPKVIFRAQRKERGRGRRNAFVRREIHVENDEIRNPKDKGISKFE
jgi:hypothetical protein